jgi:hypothetical protein
LHVPPIESTVSSMPWTERPLALCVTIASGCSGLLRGADDAELVRCTGSERMLFFVVQSKRFVQQLLLAPVHRRRGHELVRCTGSEHILFFEVQSNRFVCRCGTPPTAVAMRYRSGWRR